MFDWVHKLITAFKNEAAAENTSGVVVRIPPSPTGNLHVGTARTALFNYLYAKQTGGKVVLRLEDTDTERSKKEFEDNIVDGLQWLGITWDNETLYRQSERTAVYKKYLEQMIAENKAYISKEASEEGKRSEVIRFKNPNKEITFTDRVRGEITFDTTELGDFVIAKSLEEPLYHLAVVVDDFDMGVTHVIRGEDGISNTPRQILLQEAIGAPRPVYAHLPLLLGEDKAKLSKRNGAQPVTDFREQGFLADAMVNYLAFLGWNPGTDQELFTRDELVKTFSLDQVQKGGAIFSLEKLRWFNREYLKRVPAESLHVAITERLRKNDFELTDEQYKKLLPVIVERIDVLSDIDELVASGELDFVQAAADYPAEKLLWKKSEDLAEMKEHLTVAKEKLDTISSENFSAENTKDALWGYASEKGRGNVLWPLRYALSGQDRSPDPFEIAAILGKSETLDRIDTAIERIDNA